MESSGRNMGHRSPLFAVNEEEPAEDGEVKLADRHGPGPTPTCVSLPNKRMSIASVQFDKGNKGFLTADEESARGMANKDGDVDKGAIVDLISQNRSMKMGQRRLAVLSLFLLVALVVTGALLGARLDQATASTQVKIDEAMTTEIAQDGEGLPHLVDRASGGELTVRAEGDTFDTRQIVDPVTFRRLNCIPIHEVARMVSDLSHGVAGSVVEHNADGALKKVVSIAGNFEDHGRYLQFGSFRIELDDDGCNRGADIPVFAPGVAAGVAVGPEETSLNASAGPAATGEKKGVPGAPASEDASIDPGFVDIGPALEAAAEDGVRTRAAPHPSNADPFTRGLRLYAETPEQKATVLNRHRHAYDEVGTSIREGRQLDWFSDAFTGIVCPGCKILDASIKICNSVAEAENTETCSDAWEGISGCKYDLDKGDMDWGGASLGFRGTGSKDTCLNQLAEGLEGCIKASGTCVIDLSGDCGLVATVYFPTLKLKEQEFSDPTDNNPKKAKLIVSAEVSAELSATFDFNMDIRANPTYKEQLLKLKVTAGYELSSKFKLELKMPSSSTGTNHIGTIEAEYPLTYVPKNLFRRLFMLGPVPLLVEVNVQPMIWLDVIIGSDSILEFDINSSLNASFEVEFDIDQLSFHSKDHLWGNPFLLENVNLSGYFDGTVSARAGARFTVSVNGQPLSLDTALALRLLLKMSPEVDSNQHLCLRGSVGFTSGLEVRVSMESPANIAGKIRTACTTAASLATPLLGLMNSNPVTACAAEKIGWTEDSLTNSCNKMYDGIMDAEAFKDKCGAGALFEDIPISSWVTIIGFETEPVAAISNGCPSGVVECSSDAVESIGITGISADIEKCARKFIQSRFPHNFLPSLSEAKLCCPVADQMSCESCQCATGLKCVRVWATGKKVCSDGGRNSFCSNDEDCISTSDFCWGTCQAKKSLGQDCSKFAGIILGYDAKCFSGYCHPDTLTCASTRGTGLSCLTDSSCNGSLRCICDESIKQQQCMTITIWPDNFPEEISFKVANTCSLVPVTVYTQSRLSKSSSCIADNHVECDSWAADGECVNNPGFMSKQCLMSCVYACPSRFRYCGPAGRFRLSISDSAGDGIYNQNYGYGRWEVQYQGAVTRGIGDYEWGTNKFFGNYETCQCSKRCGTVYGNFGDAGDHCSTDTQCFYPNRCLKSLLDGRLHAGSIHLGPSYQCFHPDPQVLTRSVKILLPGNDKILSLSEVQVFTTLQSGGRERNIAGFTSSMVTQSSRYNNEYRFSAKKAVDGDTTGDQIDITSTNLESDPWWMVTFTSSHSISRIVVWNRQDCCPERLKGALILLLDDNEVTIKSYPLVVKSDPIVFDYIWWG